MINNKKILCVVTARAGSKGIKNKNYRDLFGKPLFMWSMLAALNSKYIDTIVLSSNCEECEKIHINWVKDLEVEQQDRIYFIDRPDKYATDTSKNEEALIHSLSGLDTLYGLKHNIVINLQPTSPCRLGGILDGCIEKYGEGYDSLLTATKDTPFIWQKIDGKWEYTVDKNDCCDRKMRQEFEEHEFLYHDCGSVYMTDSKILLDKECRIGYNPCIFEIEGVNSVQIDKEDDFLLIEKMIEAQGLKSLI